MRILKKILKWTAGIIVVLYIAVCIFFYAKQDDILFYPTKLAADFKFTFTGNYSEHNITASDSTVLSGLLFKADSSKGVILYLHGNGGALNTWGEIADVYTSLGYDLFILDYRGYGKSGGKITNEKDLFDDVQAAYNNLKTIYPENKIIVLGYSIGTGPAAMLAAHNKPKLLILQAPYYSMTDMMKREYPFLPAFMLKYPLTTGEFVKQTTAPVIIFHGDDDHVIYYGSSLKIKAHFKPGDRLITIDNFGHNKITRNRQYLAELKKILE
jgi:alpha-beta hydrolase superfamily lysophospholipase